MNCNITSLIKLAINEQVRNFQYSKKGSKMRTRKFKPLMRNREILLLEDLLKNLKPANCLEWGSGYSTLYFSTFLSSESTWLAIEHFPEWEKKVNALNNNPQVKTVLVPPNNFPWTDENEDGSYSDLKNYVDYPKNAAPFDFILVDGRARIACLEKAFEWISDKGVVVLHDSNRAYYHSALVDFPSQVFFHYEGRPDKGLWLGSKGIAIDKYINTATHKTLWDIHNRHRRNKINKNSK
jgi:hypothetical protein